MEAQIDYRKSVDFIDEGILALNLLRAKHSFPQQLKAELSKILEFLLLAEKHEYENLLTDKRITITRESLTSIHNSLKDLELPADDIEKAMLLLSKTDQGITDPEIEALETYLLELSQPLWSTIISEKYGR